MPVCSGSKKFYGSIWRCFYDKDSKTAERFDPQSVREKCCGCAGFDAQLYDGAFSGTYFSLEYRDKFILKGGMLVAAMVGLDARSTMDLDATVKGANVSVEDVENMMSAIIDCSH